MLTLKQLKAQKEYDASKSFTEKIEDYIDGQLLIRYVELEKGKKISLSKIFKAQEIEELKALAARYKGFSYEIFTVATGMFRLRLWIKTQKIESTIWI